MKEKRFARIARLTGRSQDKALFKTHFQKLTKKQRKFFWAIFIHCWASSKTLIDKQSFFNLWCELNYLCHELDESFPDPYDDREAIRSYCHAHPYYFIDILTPKMIANLFAEYCYSESLDFLTTLAQKLHEDDLKAAYAYANEALGLDENIDERVTEVEEHISTFS
ncbi:MAG: hypothetical protein E7650_00910 [Ruminococcaceae bacterium]|nr:hypothetical protein [Oscillospiraceae bacterium]